MVLYFTLPPETEALAPRVNARPYLKSQAVRLEVHGEL